MLALLAVAALIVVERSALVALDEVRVAGIDRLDEAQVLDAAALELGTSTLRLRLGEVAARVEALPLVRSAQARRLDPLTVLIEVEERVPELVVRGPGGSVLLDRDGVVLDEGQVAGLPVVELARRLPAVGSTVAEHPTLANAHRTWHGLSGPLRVEVEWFEAAGPDELSLHLRSGVEVRFGRADRIDEKVRALGAVLEDAGDAEIAVVDVRAPSAPVVVGP